MEIQYTFLASSPRSSVCGNVVKFLRGRLAYSGDFGHFRSKATLATSMIYKWTQSSQVFGIFSHGSPSHINLVGVVHQPIQNSICDSWTADYIMPLINRHLKIRLSLSASCTDLLRPPRCLFFPALKERLCPSRLWLELKFWPACLKALRKIHRPLQSLTRTKA